jgi:hypothetical protein
MSGALFLGIAALICAGAFFNGLRFARAERNPLAGKTLFGLPVQGSTRPVEQIRRMGVLLMIAAPIFFLVFAAYCFGLLGPTNGLQTIHL